MSTNIKYKAWKNEDYMDLLIKVITFLVSPFLAFLYSLRRIKTKSSFLIFFLFALIYGLCFTVIDDESGMFDTSDAAKWRYRFENTNLYNFSDYLQFCKEYFQFAGAEIRDLYFGTIAYVVHLFSDNYHVFFFTVALVFAFFQLKCFRIFTKSTTFDNGIVCLLLCLLFNYNSISHIGGFRFWTAAWMCVYGILQYYYYGKKIYLALLIALPLIHRGFFFIYPILILERFTKGDKIWTIGFYLSFVMSSFSVYIVRDATPHLPLFLSNMVEIYTSTDIYEQYSITKLFLSSLSNIYINVLFVTIMYKRPRTLPLGLERLYSFTLIILTIVNFAMPIPSLGGRFVVICYSFIALLWLNIMGTGSQYNYLIYLMPLFMVRALYVGFNSFVSHQDFNFFYLNPISLIFNHL